MCRNMIGLQKFRIFPFGVSFPLRVGSGLLFPVPNCKENDLPSATEFLVSVML